MTMRTKRLTSLSWCGSMFSEVQRAAGMTDTTLDNETDVMNFWVGNPAYFDGEEFARSGRLVPTDGPGEPTGMVTIASVDRSTGKVNS